MRRRRTNHYTDHRIFKETADRTKSINVYPVITRGGFRL